MREEAASNLQHKPTYNLSTYYILVSTSSVSASIHFCYLLRTNIVPIVNIKVLVGTNFSLNYRIECNSIFLCDLISIKLQDIFVLYRVDDDYREIHETVKFDDSTIFFILRYTLFCCKKHTLVYVLKIKNLFYYPMQTFSHYYSIVQERVLIRSFGKNW